MTKDISFFILRLPRIAIMQRVRYYPNRPLRSVLIAFLVLSALAAICLFFQRDVALMAWPFALAYCALLPWCVVGLLRLGPRFFLPLQAVAMVLLIANFINVTLMLEGDIGVDQGLVGLRIVLNGIYILGGASLILSGLGWLLYWRDKDGAVK